MGERIADPDFNVPADWQLYGSDIAIASGELVAGSVSFTAPRGARVVDASRIKAGHIYIVRVDITALSGSGIAWALTVSVGGAGQSITSAMSPAARAAAVVAWRSGVLIAAIADGDSSNTYIEFFGTSIGLGGGCWGSVTSLEVERLHIRQNIRQAIETAVTGLTTTGTNVFPSKVYNLQESQLPALQVITGEEQVVLEAGTLDAPQRLLSMTIKGTAQAVSGVDDTLDDIAEEVETAMRADVTLGGYCHGLDLQSSSFEFSGEGDQPVGSVLLNYLISYRTPFGDPTTVA